MKTYISKYMFHNLRNYIQYKILHHIHFVYDTNLTAQFKCNLKWYFISMWSQNIVFKKLWMLFKYQNTFRILLLSIVYSFASHILFITSKGIMEMTNDKYKQRKTIKWSINNSTVSCCFLRNLWRCYRTLKHIKRFDCLVLLSIW